MLREGTDLVFRLSLWFFVPPFLAKLLLGLYHKHAYPSVQKRPKSGSALYDRHYHGAYACVVLCYLVYCMYSSSADAEPSYYGVIGLHREDIAGKLKSHFRQSVVHLHPDKSPHADPQAFLRIKAIYETLRNSTTLHAYDCYGPDVLQSVHTSSKLGERQTVDEYLLCALSERTGFYISSILLLLLALPMRSKKGLYWRAVAFICTATLDLYVLMRPEVFGSATPAEAFLARGAVRWWNGFATHHKLACLHQLYIYGSMAFGQVANLGGAPPAEEMIKRLSAHAEALTRNALAKESDHLLRLTLEPVTQSPQMQEALRRKMGQIAAQLQLAEMLDANDRSRLQQHHRTKSD